MTKAIFAPEFQTYSCTNAPNSWCKQTWNSVQNYPLLLSIVATCCICEILSNSIENQKRPTMPIGGKALSCYKSCTNRQESCSELWLFSAQSRAGTVSPIHRHQYVQPGQEMDTKPLLLHQPIQGLPLTMSSKWSPRDTV